MTDEDVFSLLCSDQGLVVIEAPAGCGKTYQGARYASEVARTLSAGRVLILTHTHAARSVFADRTKRESNRVEIRTIDSFLTEIAAMYHRALDLPADVGSWARENNAYDVVAARCRRLLERAVSVSKAAAGQYPIIVCDEHQDASADQHAAVMALHKAGSTIRFFGDPMQIIYGGAGNGARLALERWRQLTTLGGFGQLTVPHRWKEGSPDLGKWVLDARETLPRLRRADRVAAAGVGARDDVAVARSARCREYGGACRGDLLVCPPVAADVPAHPAAVAARHRLLGRARRRMRADDRALCGDDLARAAVRAAALTRDAYPGQASSRRAALSR